MLCALKARRNGIRKITSENIRLTATLGDCIVYAKIRYFELLLYCFNVVRIICVVRDKVGKNFSILLFPSYTRIWGIFLGRQYDTVVCRIRKKCFRVISQTKYHLNAKANRTDEKISRNLNSYINNIFFALCYVYVRFEWLNKCAARKEKCSFAYDNVTYICTEKTSRMNFNESAFASFHFLFF